VDSSGAVAVVTAFDPIAWVVENPFEEISDVVEYVAARSLK
jgi:hypothetical protein